MSRTVVVTGANRGIGLGMVRSLVAQGHNVWGACRSPEAAHELESSGTAGVLALDVSDEDSITAFGLALGERTDHIDSLINNAGLNASAFGADRFKQGALSATKAAVMGQFEANMVGPMLVTQVLRPLLGKGTLPTVMYISSQLGSMQAGALSPNDVGYNASKAALNMLTVLSAATDREVTYVTMHPGWVRSDMGGPHATLSVEESATGITNTLANLNPSDSGKFFRWDGTEHPW